MAVQEAKDVIARIVKQRGFKLLGVRLLPTDNKELGQSALATEPYVLQVRKKKKYMNIHIYTDLCICIYMV